MKNLFNSVKQTAPRKSVFDLSHDVKLSTNMGNLTPTLLMECVPSDRIRLGCESLLRFAPLVAPMMHRVDVSMHYFFVPNRIVWPNWEKFITNTPLTPAGPIPAFPTVQLTQDLWDASPLCDYLGLPRPETAGIETISAIPFAMYQMIYNEYYRDQNLIQEVDFVLVDGDNSFNTDLFKFHNRCWEHDYFTSCLPFAQKGPAVDIPIGAVVLKDDINPLTEQPRIVTPLGNPLQGNLEADSGGGLQSDLVGVESSAWFDPNGSLEAGNTTINDLRRAYRLQEWFEKAARGGSRYFEFLRSFFGQRSPDSRLQRPEYITGTKSIVKISEVLNTTGTEDLPQGNMSGHGLSVTNGNVGSYTVQEHGMIMGIMSVMPKTAYQQGLHRMWSKVTDPFQYYFPQFDHIGEQEVLNKELFLDPNSDQDGTFGYVPRYAEYKFMNNRVAGEFRDTLNTWHMGRIFESQPGLNDDFVISDPTHRVFAVTDEDVQKMWCHVYHKISAIRPMSKFSTPTF